ncbi:hypothetical protein VOLCADRAFT_106978 [Volvox carteri f. nagariensis]|uniref:Uncharacterized protein n=1 Tax=Volvox carteri f. nagariensis TaxID=3068 RepID=D8UB44_VOLCA|nr:uncharacterized protein VOLCADRAFT_106978 [Volvox carteri f. nagariensis]EFJ43043.1 hypothetical protein VOLCADRAFT_106978 [Volvox carteri f. nagariensis]|eukprot:XP_002955842.1 hypothetical protein VOLCADRAFT_106978 [Volvox carteri f. nagariensis]
MIVMCPFRLEHGIFMDAIPIRTASPSFAIPTAASISECNLTPVTYLCIITAKKLGTVTWGKGKAVPPMHRSLFLQAERILFDVPPYPSNIIRVLRNMSLWQPYASDASTHRRTSITKGTKKTIQKNKGELSISPLKPQAHLPIARNGDGVSVRIARTQVQCGLGSPTSIRQQTAALAVRCLAQLPSGQLYFLLSFDHTDHTDNRYGHR